MFTLLVLLSCSISIGIILASNPATLRIWVILTAGAISCTIGFNIRNWFGLVIFLIYVGGILVIFTYFVVIQPNQQLEIKNLLLTTTISTFLLTYLLKSTNKPLLNIMLPSLIKPYLLLQSNSLIILFSIAVVLFLALVAVIKTSKINHGPLRPFSSKP